MNGKQKEYLPSPQFIAKFNIYVACANFIHLYEHMDTNIYLITFGWLARFYGKSTYVGYLISNLVYTHTICKRMLCR